MLKNETKARTFRAKIAEWHQVEREGILQNFYNQAKKLFYNLPEDAGDDLRDKFLESRDDAKDRLLLFRKAIGPGKLERDTVYKELCAIDTTLPEPTEQLDCSNVIKNIECWCAQQEKAIANDIDNYKLAGIPESSPDHAKSQDGQNVEQTATLPPASSDKPSSKAAAESPKTFIDLTEDDE